MEKVLKCKVTVISPFEFIHAEHSVASDEMVIAVSQSLSLIHISQEPQTPQQTVDAQQVVIPQESERILT